MSHGLIYKLAHVSDLRGADSSPSQPTLGKSLCQIARMRSWMAWMPHFFGPFTHNCCRFLPGLEVHIICFICSFKNDQQFKLFFDKIRLTHIIEGRLLINNMNNVERPDKEDAGLSGHIWLHSDHLHIMVQLPFFTNPPSQYLHGDLSSWRIVIILSYKQMLLSWEDTALSKHFLCSPVTTYHQWSTRTNKLW